MADIDVVFHFVAKFEAVHDRHHDIADDQVDRVLTNQIESYFPVFSFYYLIHFRQFASDEMAHIILVLDNQDHRFAGFGQRDHFHFLFLVSGSDPVTVFLLFRQL